MSPLAHGTVENMGHEVIKTVALQLPKPRAKSGQFRPAARGFAELHPLYTRVATSALG